MGLCKCPKRRVTNLFCFVHRVNVCEDCMVNSHATVSNLCSKLHLICALYVYWPQCVVQSYLKWLEDSDYDAVCVLCSNSLHQGTVVRLICYGLCIFPNNAHLNVACTVFNRDTYTSRYCSSVMFGQVWSLSSCQHYASRLYLSKV